MAWVCLHMRVCKLLRLLSEAAVDFFSPLTCRLSSTATCLLLPPHLPACLCRLEGHQALLAQWEEKVAKQLEFISELQSPTKRNSMISASAAASHRASISTNAAGAWGGQSHSSGSYSSTQPGVTSGIAQLLGEGRVSSAFGSSFGLVGGLTGAASAPNSPAMWERGSPNSLAGGLGGVSRRSAFTPGPALNGMGDTTPGGGSTPR
eukprot:GHRQ01026119.1.p1 GENE.GHRQ01026119.1~~GHRQ01026119.1.p1  ORF type:complete len:206 (-),score=27.83 GHRQ01026119.1:154-771(-)